MHFLDTALKGVFVLEPETIKDERGSFAITWSAVDLEARGLDGRMSRCAVSKNNLPHTLRGMHYTTGPDPGAKLVSCTQGILFDVALDLRPESETFCKWTSFVLSAVNRRTLYIPAGVAHGFQTQEFRTNVFYQMSAPYRPEREAGVRWNDPVFEIAWPTKECVYLSDRDRSYPDFSKRAG